MSVTLKDVGSGYKRTAINSNFDAIEAEINTNLLNKNGGVGLEADFDANSNKLINLTNGVLNQDAATVGQLSAAIAAAGSGLIASQKEVQTGADVVGSVSTFTGITYTVAGNNLYVFRNGNFQTLGIDYTETSSSSITWTTAPNSTDGLTFITNLATTNSTTDTSAITHVENSTNYNLATYLQNRYEISVADYGAVGDGIADDTAAIQAAIDDAKDINSSLDISGVTVNFPSGIFNATRLTMYSNVTLKGQYGATALICTDSTSTDANVTFGSFIRKLDDNTRGFRMGFKDLFIGTALSGVSAAEDANQNVIGLNLCACERTVVDNVTFLGFGYGAIVLARAEGGAEGLGFTGTAGQDGNYNTMSNITVGSCGKYNPVLGAIWFKYKANSNKLTGVYGKPCRTLMYFSHANDNTVFGCTAETAYSIARFGSLGQGNSIFGSRAEGLDDDAFYFDPSSRLNTIMGVWLTGVAGTEAGNIENTESNVFVGSAVNWMGKSVFPPTSSVSTTHQLNELNAQSIVGDTNQPIYVKAKNYSDGSNPVLSLWDSNTSRVDGDSLGKVQFYCSDSSIGGAGNNASIEGRTVSSNGLTEVVVKTGRESDGLIETASFYNNQFEMYQNSSEIIAKSPDGTRYKLTPPNGGGAATWVVA